MRPRAWLDVYSRLAFVFYLQSAVGFLTPSVCRYRHCATQQCKQGPLASTGSSSCTARRPLTTRLSAGLSHDRSYRSTHGFNPLIAVRRPLSNFLPGDDRERRDARPSADSQSSRTALGVGTPGRGAQGEGADDGSAAGNGSGGKDGWRQRMVRTILSVFLRIKAVFAAVGAKLGLRRSSEVRDVSSAAHEAFLVSIMQLDSHAHMSFGQRVADVELPRCRV